MVKYQNQNRPDISHVIDILLNLLILTRLTNNTFQINFSDKVLNLDLKYFTSELKIYFEKYSEDKDYTYEKRVEGENIIITINNTHTFYNSQITIESSEIFHNSLFDQNRDFVGDLTFSQKIPSIHFIKQFDRYLLKAFSIIMTLIIFSIVFCAVAIFFISFNNNIREISIKKLVFLFQDIQIIPFLLLLDSAFPSNLHYFLSLSYEHFIGLHEMKEKLKLFTPRQLPLIDHPNFFDKNFLPDFLKNFGFIFIFQTVFLIFYLILILGTNLKKFLSFKIVNVFKKLRKVLEFNLLIVIFLAFIYQIIIFALFNILHF